MNNSENNLLNEKFESKKQQRYFYAKASDPSLSPKERRKWTKMAGEFSKHTDFTNLPDKAGKKKTTKKSKKEVDEIVDMYGNIKRSKKRGDFNKAGVTQKKTTDVVVKTGGGSMGIHGVHGTHTSLRYWAESEELSKEKLLEIALKDVLGYDETMGANPPKNYKTAKKIMKKEFGLDDETAEEKLDDMGYGEKLPDGEVNLVEKKSLEDFIESIVNKKSSDDLVKKKTEEVKEINDIVKRQLKSLKNTMETHNLSIEDIAEYLKKDE